MLALIVVAWLLAALVVAGWAYWTIAWWRVRIAARPEFSIRAGLDLPEPSGDWPSVSIVVPVHNEEQVIDTCVSSLRNQAYDRIEFIFVLDRCTDGTRAILQCHADEDSRFILIENSSCPSDWAGKCHAARLGAEQAGGDCIIFTDADTWFDPNLVRAAVALAARDGVHLLSLLSTLTTHHWFERVVQPVATMNLIRMYPVERVNREERARSFANGQFMLFDRAWYERIGGHETVKDDLLEDIAFARLVHVNGGRVGVYRADHLLTCSMYDTLDQLKGGWKRIFIEACKRQPQRLRKNAWRVIGNGVALPMVQLATLVVAVVAIAAGNVPLGVVPAILVLLSLMTQIVVLRRIYRLSGAPQHMVLAYPLGSLVVARVLFSAARDLEQGVPIKWAGKLYVLKPRD